MARSLADEREELRLEHLGQFDPENEGRAELEQHDRFVEHGSEAWKLVARQPHPRERREHLKARQQERDAQLALYPDPPLDSQVTPLGRHAA